MRKKEGAQTWPSRQDQERMTGRVLVLPASEVPRSFLSTPPDSLPNPKHALPSPA